jgi:hypothetical protein
MFFLVELLLVQSLWNGQETTMFRLWNFIPSTKRKWRLKEKEILQG